jgi:ribosome maturation factor RimP
LCYNRADNEEWAECPLFNLYKEGIMEERIFDAVKAPLLEENIELVEVRMGEEDGEKTLFVVIDSENGVDLDLCVKATHIVDPIIESLNLEIEDYVLDVGSKGVSLEDEN